MDDSYLLAGGSAGQDSTKGRVMVETFDAMRFCDRTSTRYVFGAPFTLPDGNLCASDTRVLIIFPAEWHSGVKDLEGRKPKIDVVMAGFDSVTEWHRFPEVPDCAACKNSGIVESEMCDECGGFGTVECNKGHDHDCGDCEGTGVIRNTLCEDCAANSVKFGERDVALRVARQMASLPDAEWGIANDDDERKLIYCRFAGGRGGFMSMLKDRFMK